MCANQVWIKTFNYNNTSVHSTYSSDSGRLITGFIQTDQNDTFSRVEFDSHETSSAAFVRRLTLKRSDISLSHMPKVCLQWLGIKGGGGWVARWLTLFTFKVISVYQLSLSANQTKQYKLRTDVVVHVKLKKTKKTKWHSHSMDMTAWSRKADDWINGCIMALKTYSCKYALTYIMIVHSTL